MEIIERMNGSSYNCCQNHYGHQAEEWAWQQQQYNQMAKQHNLSVIHPFVWLESHPPTSSGGD